MPLILILLLAVFQCSITNYLIMNPDYYQLGPYSWESNDFRAMRLGDAVAGLDSLDTDMVTTLMVEHDYDLTGIKDTRYDNKLLAAARPADYRKLKHAYETVLGDLKYFPIPKSRNKDTPEVVFEDGWMDGRGYVSGGDGSGSGAGESGPGRAGAGQSGTGRTDTGQSGADQADTGQSGADQADTGQAGGRKSSPKRRHEGCDIMGSKMPPGYYPVVSMTDGVIEKIGWLEMGGWRVGVRAPGGAYLYYAHLYDYAGNFKEGDRVKAGELIGYMGDTGYGKTEGTRGNFDVHLHVGIYIKTDHNEEMSVNPYWILKWLEKKRLVFTY